MEGVIGFTTLFAGNFAPKNWAFCQGQIINIASNTALFSILGTTYGGNGTTTFALPNLVGRCVLGAGTGQGLSPYSLGQTGGVESVSIGLTQMPAHVHSVTYTTTLGAGTNATTAIPTGNTFSADNGGVNTPYASPADTALKPYSGNITMAPAGSGPSPISVLNPFLTMNYVICMFGVFPARN